MAWTSTNPVTVGNPTKKSDYDKLWDNCDYQLIEHTTAGVHKAGIIKKSYLSTSATDSENVQKRIAAAWVHFTGTGTVAIDAELNVDSIIDEGTGDYSVNIDTDMPDAHYCWSGQCWKSGSNNLIQNHLTVAQTASVLRVQTKDGSFSVEDKTDVSVTIFGNQG